MQCRWRVLWGDLVGWRLLMELGWDPCPLSWLASTSLSSSSSPPPPSSSSSSSSSSFSSVIILLVKYPDPFQRTWPAPVTKFSCVEIGIAQNLFSISFFSVNLTSSRTWNQRSSVHSFTWCLLSCKMFALGWNEIPHCHMQEQLLACIQIFLRDLEGSRIDRVCHIQEQLMICIQILGRISLLIQRTKATISQSRNLFSHSHRENTLESACSSYLPAFVGLLSHHT